MTETESKHLAALLGLFVNSGYCLPSGVSSSYGRFSFDNYGSSNTRIYAQEKSSGKRLYGDVNNYLFSVDYGSMGGAFEVEVRSNQVYRIKDKQLNKEYFLSGDSTGTEILIDGVKYRRG